MKTLDYSKTANNRAKPKQSLLRSAAAVRHKPGVAIYVRFATHDETSIRGQMKKCKAYLAEHFQPSVSVSKYSGGGKDSESLTQLLADAKAGKFDIVIVEDIDRLGRDMVKLAATMAQLRSAGCEVIEAASDRPVGHFDPKLNAAAEAARRFRGRRTPRIRK